MEPSIMVAPNLNGKVYREFMPQQNAINTFLDFIDIKDGHALLGSSNLNGRYWDGSICYFDKFTADSSLDLIDAVECLDVGVTDGKILPSQDKAIVSQDSGEVKLVEFKDKSIKVLKINNEEHDDFITEISLGSLGDTFITSSADASIKFWNITDSDPLNCLHTYNHAHKQLISSVSVNPIDFNLFASCSYDRTALLWDTRAESSGNLIYKHEFSALTRIEYNPNNMVQLALSTSAGDVYLIDVREPNEFIAKNACCARSVHRTSFNPAGLLAVCADDSTVRILDANDELKLIYSDDSHGDFVRGLAWMDRVLVSCGWDKKIFYHYF